MADQQESCEEGASKPSPKVLLRGLSHTDVGPAAGGAEAAGAGATHKEKPLLLRGLSHTRVDEEDGATADASGKKQFVEKKQSPFRGRPTRRRSILQVILQHSSRERPMAFSYHSLDDAVEGELSDDAVDPYNGDEQEFLSESPIAGKKEQLSEDSPPTSRIESLIELDKLQNRGSKARLATLYPDETASLESKFLTICKSKPTPRRLVACLLSKYTCTNLCFF